MNKLITIISVAASLLIPSLSLGAAVTFEFTVDSSKVTAGDRAILQVGMYSQYANGTTASGIFDDIALTGPASMNTGTKPIPFSDNFNDRSLADPTIGNNWTWFDHGFDSADCTTGKDGGYGPWSDGDGNTDYVHANNNYTNVSSGAVAEYLRAGIEEDGSGGFALNVYQNQYGKKTCNEVKIFQEFSVDNKDLLNGDYKLTATVKENVNTAIQAGNEVGVFFKVLDVGPVGAEVYTETQFVKKTGLPEQTGGGDTGGGDTGGGDNGGGTDTTPTPSVPVPVMPIGGLLGLIALIGWLGLRRRG